MFSFKEFILCEGGSEFKTLKKNQVDLDPDERVEVMKRKATWNNHPNPKYNPVPAVWKSCCPKTGKTTYITNTHRAIVTSRSIVGIINKYHKFIKKTA